MDKQLVDLEWLILRAGANEVTPRYAKRRALAALRLLVVSPSLEEAAAVRAQASGVSRREEK